MAIKKKKLKQYREDLIQSQEESKSWITLKNLFELNKSKPDRINDNLIKLVADTDLLGAAYYKLKKNKGSMTPGTDGTTPDEFNEKKCENLSKSILNGTFRWTSIRREMIPKPGKKEKRPLGIPNFTDRIVQENVRIVLQSIYEPLFQIDEFNHGFRPKRSTETAMVQLQRTSKEMVWALEGDIKSAYPSVNHDKLLQLLKLKISDNKFLKLIHLGLRHNITFEGKTEKNLIGTPQGGIASPILFNIYMHEFDKFIFKLIAEYTEINVKENRTGNPVKTKTARRLSGRIEKAKKRIEKYKTVKGPLTEKLKAKIRTDADTMRRSKNALLATRHNREKRRLLRFSYVRYADDWIFLTNATKDILQEIRNQCSDWLFKELSFVLDETKTNITNQNKKKAKFLGFTIFRKKKRIIRKTNKDGKIFRQRSTVELTLGIDHDRVRNRLIAGKIMTNKLVPRSNPIYMTLKPIYMIRKYRQRLEGLINYYYRLITYPSELNLYYYTYKFSCLKTLARRMKKSMKQITMIYGEELKMEMEIKEIIIKGKKVRVEKSSFPKYSAAMNSGKEIKEQRNKQMFIRLQQRKDRNNFAPAVSFEDVIQNAVAAADPFSMNDIAINLRSSYQMKLHCCICGQPNHPETLVEMHHLKHIRKGKVSGFSQVMKSLNRKTIPVCKSCHKKIHKGTYDGYSLKHLYDIEITQI
jgi:group II intron reverse transcriptase/maturase